MNQGIVQRTHSRAHQPYLVRARSIDWIRNPGQRIGDRSRILLFGQKPAEESIKLMVSDDVQWSRRHVITLLVTGGNEAGLWMDTEIRGTQSGGKDFDRFAVRGDA